MKLYEVKAMWNFNLLNGSARHHIINVIEFCVLTFAHKLEELHKMRSALDGSELLLHLYDF